MGQGLAVLPQRREPVRQQQRPLGKGAGRGQGFRHRLPFHRAGLQLSAADRAALGTRFRLGAAVGADRPAAGLVVLQILQGHILHPAEHPHPAPAVAVKGDVLGHQLLPGCFPLAPQIGGLLPAGGHIHPVPFINGLLGLGHLDEQVVHLFDVTDPRLGNHLPGMQRRDRQLPQRAVAAALGIPLHQPEAAALDGHGALLQVVQVGQAPQLDLVAQHRLDAAGQFGVLRVDGLHPGQGQGAVHLAFHQFVGDGPHVAAVPGGRPSASVRRRLPLYSASHRSMLARVSA